MKEAGLALAFPLLVIAVWHLSTQGRAYSLIPPPAEVAVALYDLAFGGINDDAFSQTLHVHVLASISRVYGGFLLAAAAALPLGLMIGRIPSCASFSTRPSRSCGRSRHGLAAARHDPVRARSEVRLLPRLPRSLLPDPRQHDLRRALGRAAPVRGGEHAGLPGHRTVPAGGAAREPPGHLHGPAARARLRLGRDRGRRDDRRADGLGAIIMEARQLSRTEIVISGMITIGIAGYVSDRLVTLLGRRLLAWSPSHG
jgi:NitT/TauT family transport system permease protein